MAQTMDFLGAPTSAMGSCLAEAEGHGAVGAKNYKPQATKQPASPDLQSAVRHVPLSLIAKPAAIMLYSHSAMSFSR